MADPLVADQSPHAADVADYVAAASAELAAIARQSGLDVLEHLLQMARLEAENVHQLARE